MIQILTSDEEGRHVFFTVYDTQFQQTHLYYIHQETSTFEKVAQVASISALTVVTTDEGVDGRMVEVLIGTKQGTIGHGKFYLEKNAKLKVEEKIDEQVLNCQTGEEVYDIKIIKTQAKVGILALTDGTFHQFWGKE